MYFFYWKVNSEVSQSRPIFILRKLDGQQAFQTDPWYIFESGIRAGADLGANQVAYRSAILRDNYLYMYVIICTHACLLNTERGIQRKKVVSNGCGKSLKVKENI